MWLLVTLLGAAVAIAVVTRRFAIPYTVGLVLLGLALSVVGPGVALPVDPDLLLAIVLPGLVFEAAFRTDLAAGDPGCRRGRRDRCAGSRADDDPVIQRGIPRRFDGGGHGSRRGPGDLPPAASPAAARNDGRDGEPRQRR